MKLSSGFLARVNQVLAPDMQDGLRIIIGEPVRSFRVMLATTLKVDSVVSSTRCAAATRCLLASTGISLILMKHPHCLQEVRFGKYFWNFLDDLLLREGSPGMDIPRCLLLFQQLNGHSHGKLS